VVDRPFLGDIRGGFAIWILVFVVVDDGDVPFLSTIIYLHFLHRLTGYENRTISNGESWPQFLCLQGLRHCFFVRS